MKRYCILLLITLLCFCSCNQKIQQAETIEHDSITEFFKKFYVGCNDYYVQKANANQEATSKSYYQYLNDKFISFLKDFCCDDIIAQSYHTDLDIYGQSEIDTLNDSIFDSLYVEKVKGEKDVNTVHLQIDPLHIQRLYTLTKQNGKMKIYAIGKRKHPMAFHNDTLRIERCPQNCKGFYQWHRVAVSNYYMVADSLILSKDYRVAVLTPYFEREAEKQDEFVYSDRLLLIEYKNQKLVYDNVISDEDYVGGWSPYEMLVKPSKDTSDFLGLCDFILTYCAGNGYKVYYSIGIKMIGDRPYVTGIKWEEHDSGLLFHKQTMQVYDGKEMPLSTYSRWMPWELQQE